MKNWIKTIGILLAKIPEFLGGDHSWVMNPLSINDHLKNERICEKSGERRDENEQAD
jgi:hypothetical protein